MGGRESEMLSAKQVARMHGVHVTTVTRWILSGKLPAKRRAGRQYVIERRDAEAILQPVEPDIPVLPMARQHREAEDDLRRQGFKF